MPHYVGTCLLCYRAIVAPTERDSGPVDVAPVDAAPVNTTPVDAGSGEKTASVEELTAAPLVMMLARRMRQARLAALEPFGLAPHQARAFTIIARHSGRGELRPSDLARRLGIAPRSATEVVDALAERGLVQRTPSPTDRRATMLSVTDAGRELLAQMHGHPDSPDDRVFARLSPAELAILTALLRRAVADGEADPHPDAPPA